MFKRKIYDKLVSWKNESDGETHLTTVTLAVPATAEKGFMILKSKGK